MRNGTIIVKASDETIETAVIPAMAMAEQTTYKDPVIGDITGSHDAPSPIYDQIAASRGFNPMEDETSPGEREVIDRLEKIRKARKASNGRNRNKNKRKWKPRLV